MFSVAPLSFFIRKFAAFITHTITGRNLGTRKSFIFKYFRVSNKSDIYEYYMLGRPAQQSMLQNITFLINFALFLLNSFLSHLFHTNFDGKLLSIRGN